MTNDRNNAPSSPEWLIWLWGNHDCPCGSVDQTRWNLSGVDRFQTTTRHSGVRLACVTYYVKLCTVLVYRIYDRFCFHYDLYIFGIKVFLIFESFNVIFVMKKSNFDGNFTEVCSQESNWQWPSIGSDIGLAPSHYLSQCSSDLLTHICGTKGRRVNFRMVTRSSPEPKLTFHQ